MRFARLAGLSLVVGCAVVLATAATASANPLFLPVGASFTLRGGPGTLRSPTADDDVWCPLSDASGTIASALLAGPFLLTFTGCLSEAKNNGTKCTIKSTGEENEGDILTGTVHAVLVLVLISGEPRWPGLWILPVETKKFVKLEKNECTPATEVEGSTVGLISPIGKSQATGKLVFDPSTGATLDLHNGQSIHIPGLEAFGTSATEETTAEVLFSENVEVT